MAKWLAHARFTIGALTLALMIAVTAPASAQQPSQVNPNASAVQEDQLLNALRAGPGGGDAISGRVSIPDQKSGNLIQPAGQAWRTFHENALPWIGGIAILGMLALLVVFYLMRGMVKIENGRSGRLIVRFNAFERGVHWMTATCFIVLAITGLNITFGKSLLLPLLGPEG
jgi:formate dehydrogenase subunit gamma